MSSIAQILKDTRAGMDKVLENSKREFGSIRSGKATVSLLDTVRVEAYGQQMPITQLANVSAPEPRLLTVTPWDKGLTSAIEKAIRDSDLGLNPATSGEMIRVPMPPLTEERRKELTKVVHKEAEAAKIAVRNVRRDANEHLKKLLKDKECSEDEERRAHEDLQKLTDRFIAEVDRLLQVKEADLMAI